MSDVRELSLAEGIAEVEAGGLSADEWFDAYAGLPDELGAYLWRPSDGEAAGGRGETVFAPGRRGDGSAGGELPLAGAPIAVKDIFCVEGLPTTAGSRILEGYVPPYTASAVERLLASGARILGKANMDEFAMGSSNENSAFGPVRNPWDTSRVPGGSSGGSAAAVAGGLAPCAIGTDTGGSIRQPASFCGVVGLKPTYGAISRSGMIAFASSLDQCGPFTRDVRDAALLLRAMEGSDPRDSTATGIAGGVGLPEREDLSGLRIGVPRELSSEAEGIEDGVRETFDRAVELCERLGAEVSETTLPNARHGISAYYVIAPAEASANLARYDGVRFGLREGAESLDEMYERTRSVGFGAEVKRRIMLGTYALSSGYYDAYYGRAQRVRTLIARDFATVFADFDLLIAPTSPTAAFGLGERSSDPLAMYMSDYCTVPMSLAGVPTISIPAGLAAPAGGGPELPVGLQIAGPAFSESLILDAAHAIEGAVGFDPRAAWRDGGTDG